MHRKHFFVPATGAPAGDYELYLLGLDWLPEAIQPCCASGECGSSAPFVTRTTAERLVLHGLWPRSRAWPLPPEPDALLEAARLQILRGGRGAALAGVWELSR